MKQLTPVYMSIPSLHAWPLQFHFRPAARGWDMRTCRADSASRCAAASSARTAAVSRLAASSWEAKPSSFLLKVELSTVKRFWRSLAACWWAATSCWATASSLWAAASSACAWAVSLHIRCDQRPRLKRKRAGETWQVSAAQATTWHGTSAPSLARRAVQDISSGESLCTRYAECYLCIICT